MGKQLKEKIKYWAQILLLPMYWFSFFVPRNQKIWVFGSTFGKRFADNPRYFYLYMSQYYNAEIESVWISKDKKIVKLLNENGYKAFDKNSWKGFLYCLRGGTYIYDNYSKDISFVFSGGARKINLWHGLPLKKIQKDNINDIIRNPRNIREKINAIPRRISDEKPSDYVLTASHFFVSIFSSAFQTGNVIVSGYPRCDVLISDKIKNVLNEEEQKSKDVIKRAKEKGIEKVILYMPTFRDSETKFFETVQLDELQKFLEENNYLFCVKLHCKSKLSQLFEKMENKNIHVISSDADPYCFLRNSDLLLTDYSSIYFDYLLMDKPILFFSYDYVEYIEKSREMYFKYDEFAPGKIVITWSEAKEVITAIFKNMEERKYLDMRKDLKNKLFTADLSLGSEQLYRILRDLKK